MVKSFICLISMPFFMSYKLFAVDNLDTIKAITPYDLNQAPHYFYDWQVFSIDDYSFVYGYLGFDYNFKKNHKKVALRKGFTVQANISNTPFASYYPISPYEFLFLSDQCKKVIVDTFKIKYIASAPLESINAGFPIISLESTENHNAWIQIIQTDTTAPGCLQYQHFIDTTTDENLFPFYTWQQLFIDTPCWSYSIEYKPLSYWKAHAYPVLVDKKTKNIQILQGIEWGYRFFPLSFRPTMIEPRKLTKEEIKKDKLFFQARVKNLGFRVSSLNTDMGHF